MQRGNPFHTLVAMVTFETLEVDGHTHFSVVSYMGHFISLQVNGCFVNLIRRRFSLIQTPYSRKSSNTSGLNLINNRVIKLNQILLSILSYRTPSDVNLFLSLSV